MVARLYKPVEGKLAEPAEFGLLSSRTLVEDGEMGGGISVENISCNVNARVLSGCDELNSEDTTVASGAGSTDYVPFFIQTEYTCSTFGFKKDQEKYFNRAVTSMDLCQGKAIEKEFWTGVLAKADETVDVEENPNPNRFLASSDAVDVTPTAGTAVKPRLGLALLEQALGDCGCGVRGFIHATRGIGSAIADDLDQDDDVLRTHLGNYFIPGIGYDGSGPDGTVPSGSQRWMYATGPVAVRLGKVQTTPSTLSEALNTSTNEITVMAERDAAVTWDGCCHYAVLVDLSLDYS